MILSNSRVLNYFSIKLDVFVVFVSLAFIIMLIAMFFLLLDYLKMRKRYLEFMKGESGKELEYTIYKRFREIDTLKEGQKDNDDQIAIMYHKIRQSYNKLGIFRYDAFNQNKDVLMDKTSFALTLLNSENNGFIINVIHSRSGCHMYMKEIEKGKCEGELAEEEKISLNMALKDE